MEKYDIGEKTVAEYLDTLAHILSEPTRLSLTWNYAVFAVLFPVPIFRIPLFYEPLFCIGRYFAHRCFELAAILHTAVLKPLFWK